MTTGFNFYELKISDRLPTPSGTALAIMQLAQREDASAQELTHVVQADPALTGRLLRLVNSPLVGVRRSVVYVGEAVALLGMTTVKQVALSLSLVGKYRQGHCDAFDYAAYWTNSLASAVALQALAGRERVVPPEEAFTLGLLADIGRLALATCWPAEFAACLRRASGWALCELERARFAIDHDELSLMLLDDWGFPSVFLEALKRSLEAETAEESRTARLARQLAFARPIAAYVGADQNSRQVLLPELQALMTRHALGAEALEALLAQVESEWREWGELIGIETGRKPSADVAREAPPVAKLDAGGLDVLLVDDDPVMLEWLAGQIEAEGHRVAVCRDGESALKYALTHSPQMVITDWRMTPMDGLQLCRALRASAFGKSLYVIMFTVTEDEDALVKAFAAGIDDYIIKPTSVKILSARIRAGQRIINLQQDLISERKRIERYSAELAVVNRRLETMAHTDLLTGLPNRRYGLGRLEQEWMGAQRFHRPLSVMMLDLDHFKSVNDAFGHDVGDKVLAHAAKLMRATLRVNDIVCRFGGEEFLVIAPDTEGSAALQLAERVRRGIEGHQPEELALAHPLTVSIGVSVSMGDQPGWRDLIKLADQALYQVKQTGRNGVKLAP
ncbi:diguanylate cyclase [Methylococcus sp. EFPC2]|uniref:diguanylate cyclase n=1 Tax=Methylococcus sp. EFPC2 TaxID=2812648 RepID=UPI00196722A2|nr:diguanylate cyclase [Methylococcus sp. EFPC2]QSA96060.1 diguanylate cyclase [Methylococcus sp. EFPC2]